MAGYRRWLWFGKNQCLAMQGNSNKRDLLLISAITLLAYLFYVRIDPLEMLAGDINPWDSSHYRSLSDQMLANGLIGLAGLRPFCYRLVQPAFATLVKVGLHSTYAKASHAVNLVCTLLVNYFSFSLWRRLGLGRLLCYGGLVFATVSWLGPLRYSIYYPGGQFAFEVLVTCIAYWSLKEIISSERLIGRWLASVALFIATLGRENVFYLVIISLFFLWIYNKQSSAALRARPALVSLGSSLGGYLVARLLVIGEGQYSILDTVTTFGLFHLNVLESLYMYFYAFGALFLAFLLCISFRASRRLLIERISDGQSLDKVLIIAFCLASFLFAFVGGTDSDRFLWWGFPFYFFVGLSCLCVLHQLLPKGLAWISVFAILFVAAALSSRLYVPAIPNLLFTSKFNARFEVRTNLNPGLYKGTDLLLPMREQLLEVARQDAYNSPYVKNIESLPRAFLPAKIVNSIAGNVPTASPYSDAYRYAANNIPFPFGFAHNQNELLAAHPYHGELAIRLVLIAQWFLIYVLLMAIMSRSLPGTKARASLSGGEVNPLR